MSKSYKIVFLLQAKSKKPISLNDEPGWYTIFDDLCRGNSIVVPFNKKGIEFVDDDFDFQMLDCKEDGSCYFVIYFSAKYSDYSKDYINSLYEKLNYLQKCRKEPNIYDCDQCLACGYGRFPIGKNYSSRGGSSGVDLQYSKYCSYHHKIQETIDEEKCIMERIKLEEKYIAGDFRGLANYIDIFITRGLDNHANLSDKKYNMKEIFPLNEVFHEEKEEEEGEGEEEENPHHLPLKLYFTEISDEQLNNMKVNFECGGKIW